MSMRGIICHDCNAPIMECQGGWEVFVTKGTVGNSPLHQKTLGGVYSGQRKGILPKGSDWHGLTGQSGVSKEGADAEREGVLDAGGGVSPACERCFQNG